MLIPLPLRQKRATKKLQTIVCILRLMRLRIQPRIIICTFLQRLRAPCVICCHIRDRLSPLHMTPAAIGQCVTRQISRTLRCILITRCIKPGQPLTPFNITSSWIGMYNILHACRYAFLYRAGGVSVRCRNT